MVSAEVANITEQEAELYDRQIRLWGLDAQKRLRSAKICVLGVSGLGAEITKNLVLSGINSMDLVDDAKVGDMDATSQFLAPRDQLGQNRAEASLQRLQQLNPMVSETRENQRGMIQIFRSKFLPIPRRLRVKMLSSSRSLMLLLQPTVARRRL